MGYGSHPGLAHLRRTPRGAGWLDALDDTVAACANEWSLRPGRPYPYAGASLALECTAPDGAGVVLKVQFPDHESEHEAAALARWDGHGAVRLLAHDARRRALLLEQCQPGTPLAGEDPHRALEVLAGVVHGLSIPAGAPFRTLELEAAGWEAQLERWRSTSASPVERRLLDAGLRWLEALRATPAPKEQHVLVHQDLHAANVLRARREPWLAIDPKPLVAERAFAVAPVVRGAELGHDRRAVRRRLDAMVAALGVERERAVGWTVVQTLAWSREGELVLPRHLELAGWLLDVR